MTTRRSSGPRPMNVFVRPGSKAELACRRYAAHEDVPPKEPPPRFEVIAPGFSRRNSLNLGDHDGKIIQDLVYTNFFVGGSAWDPHDIQRIDENLEKAMTDQHLNNVLIQYFRGAANITSTFRPSSRLSVKPDTISQPEVESLLTGLHSGGKLTGFDFSNTVFNFMLPKGTVLTIDDGSGDKVEKVRAKCTPRRWKKKRVPWKVSAVSMDQFILVQTPSTMPWEFFPKVPMESSRSMNLGRMW